MLFRFCIIGASLVALLTGSSVAFAQAVTNSQLSRYNLEKLWSSNAVLNRTRDAVEHLVMDEETIYAQTNNGFITAIDSQTGQRRWAHIFGRLDTPQYPVASNSNVVLIAAGRVLYAVNKWTGTQLFELEIPAAAGTVPVMDEERIYIGTITGSVYAFDLKKIYSLYQENLLPKWSYQTQVWRHSTAEPISHRPLLRGNQLTFASETGTLYSVEADRDRLIFQMETREPVSAPIVSYEDTIFVATHDKRLYCLDSLKGTVRWVFVARAPIEAKPFVINDQAYIYPKDGTLYCLDANSGRLLWKEEEGSKMLAKTEHYIVSEDRIKNLLLISVKETRKPASEDNGELVSALPDEVTYDTQVVARLPLREYSIRARNELTDRLYLATPDGEVVCLKERGKGYPKYYKNPEKRPIDPVFFDPSMQKPADKPGDATPPENQE